jgi:ABC-type transport system substrate-binding protein
MAINLKTDLFKDVKVREAIDQTIDKEHIVNKIVSDEVVPNSYIPPKMLGYDPDLAPRNQDISYAKLLMKGSGYPINDKRLKNLSLLHTDGLLTVEIAKKVQADLRSIGMKVALVEVNYADEDKWIKELSSGKHDFYLLGYKSGIEQLFTDEATSVFDSYSLIAPLFKTGGEVNFSSYSNPKVDKLLGQLESINIALKSDRNAKLKKINQILYKDIPAIVLFYIEKL